MQFSIGVGSSSTWSCRNIILSSPYSMSSVTFSATNDIVFAGGSCREIIAWDRRSMQLLYTLPGHMGPVIGIRLSPDGTRLLSSAVDNTLRIWDIAPSCEAPSGRLLRVLEGATHDMDEHQSRPAWSNDGVLVSSGAANGTVLIWETRTGHVRQTLSNHQACVNQVDFHPRERIGKGLDLPEEITLLSNSK